MSTMLERRNPLEQLRPPSASQPGRARRILAELDTEVTGIFGTLEPKAPAAPPPPPRRGLHRLRPVPRPLIPRISITRVPQPGPAVATEMPRSLTWLPMLRGAVNTQLDVSWRAWLGGWDRTIALQRRICQAMAEATGVAYRIKEEILAEKTVRTINYFTRAIWEDYLSIFGAVEGTVGAHILRELGQLEALAA